MISSFFLAPLIALVLVAWLALLDAKLKSFWGEKYSFSKALLLLLSFVSGIYQLAFILYLPWLFPLLNAVGVGIPILFYRIILKQWRGYATALNLRISPPTFPIPGSSHANWHEASSLCF